MYPTHTPGRVHLGPEYLPYFYASGRFSWHDLPGTGAARPDHSASPARYDFTSDLTDRRGHFAPSVEDVIRRGYFAVPNSDPETALIPDKKHTSWLGLDDVIGQIKRRYEIYRDHMYQIELGKCYTKNSMLAVIAHRGNVAVNSREAYSLTKNINELYEQQRDERVRLWQDVSKLRQLLPEHAQSYLASYRKLAILEDTRGDPL
jgi:hypothetical protein